MKKNRFQRLLSALLTAALLLSMLPVFGWAEDASAPTMQIIVPEAESILIGNHDLRVEWAPVAGAAYYLFTAKNLTTDEYITEREDLGPLCEYEILAMYLPYDSSFRFWVGAFDASGVQLAGSDVEYVVYTSSEAEAEAYFQQISGAAPEAVDEPAIDASNESAPTHSEPVAPEIVDEPAVDASNESAPTHSEPVAPEIVDEPAVDASNESAPTHSEPVAPEIVDEPAVDTSNESNFSESAPNHSGMPAPEVVDEPTIEVPAETAIPEPAQKPADPIVSIVIDGTAMAAQWAAVEGAERYVYSLRCLTDDRLLANHEPTDGCNVSRNLAPGKQYKIAVAAVPFGVSDTIADAARCGWGEATFSIAASTETTVDVSNESAPNHSGTPAPEVVDEPAIEVPAETAIPEPAQKPADPIVSIVIDGTAMAAQWAAVEGAERYVYSLRCLTDDRLLANHEPTDGCSVSRNLAPGKQYKIAVAAVPFGVSDTIADAARCGWGEATFSIAASTETTVDVSSEPILPEPTADASSEPISPEPTADASSEPISLEPTADASSEPILPEPTADASSEPVLPETTPTHSEPAALEVNDAAHAESFAKVLSVATDMSSNAVGLGERVTVTIVCNPATAALDVYDLNYLTLTSHAVNEQGNPTFEYTAEYADEGAHSLRFVALNARNEWSSESADQGFAQIMVCSHSATTVLIDASVPTNYSELQHQVTYTYRKSCLCGQVFEEYAEVALAAHEERSETLSYELTHTPGLGHRKFYKCSCGAHPLSGGASPTQKDYYAYVEALGKSSRCSVCRAEYEKRRQIMEVQTMLNQLGYSVGLVDGLWGEKTRTAMNQFRSEVMGLEALDFFDDATYQKLKFLIENGSSLETPDATEIPAATEVPDEVISGEADIGAVTWTVSYNAEQTVLTVSAKADSGVLPKGTYMLAIGIDDVAHYRLYEDAANAIALDGAGSAYTRTYKIAGDLNLQAGRTYYIAVVPSGWSDSFVWPNCTMQYNPATYEILSPSADSIIQFFNIGKMDIRWAAMPNVTNYTVQLIENGKVVYAKDVANATTTSILARNVDLDPNQSHQMQIVVTARDSSAQ